MLTNDNSVIKQTSDAKNLVTTDNEKEMINIAYQAAERTKIRNKDYSSVTASELNQKLTEKNAGATASGENPIIVTFQSGNRYSVDNEGNITKN